VDKPPFDAIRACFYLIASVLAFQGLVGLIGLGHCLWWGERIVEGRYSCENIGAVLNQLLQGALAAVLAFAAGFSKRDK
jgi:hypothetical protein